MDLLQNGGSRALGNNRGLTGCWGNGKVAAGLMESPTPSSPSSSSVFMTLKPLRRLSSQIVTAKPGTASPALSTGTSTGNLQRRPLTAPCASFQGRWQPIARAALSSPTSRTESMHKGQMTLQSSTFSQRHKGFQRECVWHKERVCPWNRGLGSCQAPGAGAQLLGSRTRTCALLDLGTALPVPAQQVLESQDAVATGLAFMLALLWVRLWDELVVRGVVDSKLSRKLVHITTGLLFMLTWPFFSNGVEARYFAAAVPAANILRLSLLGLGITKNEAVVKAVSREGSARELLRGPLFYVITIALVTIIFWRTSPIGSIALAMMCGGDGVADIVGRRLGSEKLPWNPNKSWAGSIAMFLFGSSLSIFFVYLFCSLGFYSCSWWSLPSCLTISAIALGATIVESLPISSQLDDNFTVPLTSIMLGLVLLRSL